MVEIKYVPSAKMLIIRGEHRWDTPRVGYRKHREKECTFIVMFIFLLSYLFAYSVLDSFVIPLIISIVITIVIFVPIWYLPSAAESFDEFEEILRKCKGRTIVIENMKFFIPESVRIYKYMNVVSYVGWEIEIDGAVLVDDYESFSYA